MACCEVCGKEPIKARGLCNAHYQKAKARALVDLFERVHFPLAGRLCSIEGCGRPSRSRLYCSMHYARLRVTGDVGGPGARKAPAHQPCSVDGCAAMAKARSYCQRHYQQWRAKGDPGSAERIHRPRGTGSIQQGYHITRTRLEHRLVWEDANGPIPDKMVIHHINGDKLDNRIENLELMTRSEHASHHQPRRKRKTG